VIGGAVAVARRVQPIRSRSQAGGTISFHSAADSPPSTETRFPRSLPTMSMLSIATTSPILRPEVGRRVKAVEPSVPASSPEKAIR